MRMIEIEKMTETIHNVLDRIEAEAVTKVAPEATSLDLLQAVYRNRDVPLSVRMRAAGMAIPYEFPKLSVVASVSDSSAFAERLERAIQRSGVRPLMIEHDPTRREIAAPQADVTGPMVGTDRKMRRL
jgi:hypothetical protein